MGEAENQARSEFRRRFWDFLCEYDDYLIGAVLINFLMVGLLLFAAPGISRDSTAFVIMVVDVAILLPLIVVTVYLAYRCRSREHESRF